MTDLPPPGLRCRRLRRLPLALCLPGATASPPRALPVDQPLICPVGYPGPCRRLDAGLRAQGLTWYPRWTVDSLAAVSTLVAAFGLSLDFAPLRPTGDLTLVPLVRFQPVDLMAVTAREPGPLTHTLIDELVAHTL